MELSNTFTMPPNMRPEMGAIDAGLSFKRGYQDKPVVVYNCPETIWQIQEQPLAGVFNNGWRRRLVLLYADPHDGKSVWSIGCFWDQSKVVVAHESVCMDFRLAISMWKDSGKIYSRD